MNRLQSLPTNQDYFVTLGPENLVPDSKIIHIEEYTHPIIDQRALAAQRNLWRIQGQHQTWYCGSYCGYGFHEDGLQSGLAVAERLGGLKRPWKVRGESGRIHLGEPANQMCFQEAAE